MPMCNRSDGTLTHRAREHQKTARSGAMFPLVFVGGVLGFVGRARGFPVLKPRSRARTQAGTD